LTERTCYKCSLTKQELLFKKKYKRNGAPGYTNKCLDCTAQENKDWIIANRELSNHRAKVRRWERKARAVEHKGGVCEHCKQSFHPSAFDFHHLDSGEKHKDPGLMMSHSDASLFKELDKCILLCANCHRIEHFHNGY
jgi:hypothetical protein